MADNVYLNGRIIPAAEATISAFDAGLLHGASSFTTMLARDGRVFRLDRHLGRLFDTLASLGLQTSATREQLAEAVAELLTANELADARVRITLTPGPLHTGRAGEGSAPAEPTTLITAEPLPHYPEHWYTKGIGVVISSQRQLAGDITFGRKTGCYLPRILARREAAAKGVDEALWFTNTNRLAEACFCNVFLVLGGEVLTPPLETPVLPGVVREAVLELCSRLDIPASDSLELTVREMLDAQEAFLTSSTMGIRPVVRIESHAVGDEKPGPVTRRIMDAYRQLIETECPPREEKK
jgi:branched-chain amino acid aminotransferase